MEMNASQMQENEQSITDQKQLEWVNSLNQDELRKTYSDSRYLKWIGNVLHIFSAIAIFIALLVYYGEFMGTDEGSFRDSIISLISLAFSLASLVIPFVLNKIKANRWIKMFFYLISIALGIVFLYYFVRMTWHSPVRAYCRYLAGLEKAPVKPSARVISDALKIVFWYLLSIPVLESTAFMLQRNRSKGTRVFLIVAALVFGASGVIGLLGAELKLLLNLLFFFLMPPVFYIALKNRNSLFNDFALSHVQLGAVLKQKKQNVPDNEIVIPEDEHTCSCHKVYYWIGWICMAIFVAQLIFVMVKN